MWEVQSHILLFGWLGGVVGCYEVTSVTSEGVEVDWKQLDLERKREREEGGRINSNLTNRGSAWWEESRRCFESVFYFI